MQDFAPTHSQRRRWLQAAVGGAWLAHAGAMASQASPARPAAAAKNHDARNERPVLPPQLPRGLASLLASSGLPADAIGLHVQGVHQGAPWLASHNGERTFQLASTAKLVTSLAALDLLGPEYRWRTPAFATGTMHDGQLLGDLVILGVGDAMLSSEDLLAWFTQIQQQGLKEIRGNIVIDRVGFRLTPADLASTPPPGPDRPHHALPDAFTLDEGRLRLRVQAAAHALPRLQLMPAVAGLHVHSRLGNQPGACRVSAELAPPLAGQQARRLLVQGNWPAHCGSHELQLMPWTQQDYAQRAVGALWRQAGGRLHGQVVMAPDEARETAWPLGPEGRRMQAWSVHRSEPLPQVLRDINKLSDNLAARNLMMSLAPGFPWQVATLPGARDRVDGWLRQTGLMPGDIRVDSGSGLSRGEQGKPRALVHLLRLAWRAPQRDAFVSSLPVAGVDGTLAHRMTRGAATGRAFLKTGTLLDTRALAGYVLGKSGTPYALTALVNHPDAQRAIPMLDGVVEWLAGHG